jgi:ABC-type branched-subunit amino acid transport system ATPase component
VLLSVEKISKAFGDQTVLDGISLETRQGDRVAMVGPIEASQSTLCKILTGELHADSGSSKTKIEQLDEHYQETIELN